MRNNAKNIASGLAVVPQRRKLKLRVRTARKVVVHRSYKLKLYSNPTKTDTARYTYVRFNQYCNLFMGRVFFGQKISTKGLGGLASKALWRALKIFKAMRAAKNSTGKKTNVPFITRIGCPCMLEKSNSSSFDYWISISNQFTKTSTVRLPAKSHKALNRALRQGWILSGWAEFKIINRHTYAIVKAYKTFKPMPAPNKIIGIDVGYKYSIVTSKGHIGRNTAHVIWRSKQIHSERRRQGHKISSKVKSTIKQVLDKEAKRLIGRSGNVAFAVESPKVLANLRSGSLHGWARCYFANRMSVLCKENGLRLIEVNPYQTSMTCSKCEAIDKQSRVSRDRFKCTTCSFELQADINGARCIALKGIRKIKTEKSCMPESLLPNRLSGVD